MEPDSLHDPITIQNVDAQPFEIIYNKGSYGYIMPGEIRNYPRFLVDHFLKHLIDQILNNRGESTANVVARAKLQEQIVLKEEKIARAKPLTQEDRIKKEIEQLNGASDLNAVLARRRAEDNNPNQVAPTSKMGADLVLPELEIDPTPPAPQIPVPPVAPQIEQAPVYSAPVEQPVVPQTQPEAFAAPVAPVQQETPVVAQTPISATPVQDNVVPTTGSPDRQTLVNFAQNVMKLDITDAKTKAYWDTISDEQLAKEIGYEEGI